VRWCGATTGRPPGVPGGYPPRSVPSVTSHRRGCDPGAAGSGRLARLTSEPDLPAPQEPAEPEPPAAVPEAGGHPGRPTPSGPPSKLARNVVVGVLICFVIASNLANAFLSVLVTDHPLLFMGLNAQNRNLALASAEVSAWSFYLVGFLRLLGPDPFFFLLGRWYGDGAIRWMERKAPTYGEMLRQLETWFHKARLPVVAFAPNNYVCLFAGASGMGWGAFLAANVVGTAVRLWLIRVFSEWFDGPLGSVKDFIADYRWPLLALSIAVVLVSIVSERRAGRDAVLDLAAMDDNITAHEPPADADRP